MFFDVSTQLGKKPEVPLQYRARERKETAAL